MLNALAVYLQYPFVRYALIVGVLVALCAALLGVPLVLRRFSFIGDGLSHVAFGAMAVAAVVGLIPERFAGRTPDEIMETVLNEIYRINRLLPGYKRIHEVKFVLNPMPKTSTMKVIRNDVIKIYHDMDRRNIPCMKK